MASAFATDPAVVADQAAVVAAAWSAPGAPDSWQLTAAQFETLRDDPELLRIASAIDPERLPPLLFGAAATSLVLELEPHPLRDWFPRVGQPQPPLGDGFRAEYRSFCLDHRNRLMELCGRHRYQMNEVGRCADVLPALAPAVADGREVAIIDIGTGAGLALHLDRYRYEFRRSGGERIHVGDPGSAVVIETELRGEAHPPVPLALPRVADRVGIDVEPLDLARPEVRAWLAACIPQETGAVTRFQHAVDVAMAHPTSLVQGEAMSALPGVLSSISDEAVVCLLDSYVHVFFAADELERFRALVDEVGATRDLDWISVDPLVPMGASATHSVVGLPVPQAIIDRNRAGAVFGLIGRVSYRGRQAVGLPAWACPSGSRLARMARPGRAGSAITGSETWAALCRSTRHKTPQAGAHGVYLRSHL